MAERRQNRDHNIGTFIEDGYVKLDFGGAMTFLKLPPSEARKLSKALSDLADTAEDPVNQLVKDANDALGRPDTVGMAISTNIAARTVVVRLTEYVNRLEFTAEQGTIFATGFQHYLSQLVLDK